MAWASLAFAQAGVRARRDADFERDLVKQRAEWFAHGRIMRGGSAAELRRRAYKKKMDARAARRAAYLSSRTANANSRPTSSASGWTVLGPLPLASDASGNGFQNYNQVSGRATAVAIDPADATGNTVYIGGAQGGVWKSTNAAAAVANSVTWSPLTDDQATLAIGSIAIQPGNANVGQSVILVGTGEADNTADSYFGLGILRSADGGNTWTLIETANAGALSFSGLGGTRMAFSTATGQTGTVVAAMAASTEGIVSGALTPNTYPGLYTSTDAGLTWTYDSIFSGGAAEATSATSVVYNAAAGLFFAALRYHGFYFSPDGSTWTALPNQPGPPGLLGATACPQNYVTTCPIYRAEISVVPGRNEMYVWFVSPDGNGNPVDQGIWQSENGGASWVQINESGITNCGDYSGCGVDQGFFNLALLALPDGQATDLYAGAVNLYKCEITSINSACANTPFLNLTHVYGCDPLGELAHVNPDQHAMAYVLSAGLDLMYFANDGGIYRALNGYTDLTSGSCTTPNQFDDLNQNLGPMTQFVAFSQSATNADLLLGGTQGNGSPATDTATTNSSWGNVLSGDGGFNAIDPNTGIWFASNPDTGGGSLNIQDCYSGVGCTDSLFNVVVSSADMAGDDGGFYFPYILDPQSTSTMVVGSCRVWSGPRSGGAFTELSLNFDTLGIGTCSGTEVNVVRALAAGGPMNANGSQIIYATTDGPGPNDLGFPIGGNVWVTTNAEAVSGVASTFANTTLNGPGGASINGNQFPISGVAIDASDPTGNTAYVTVMGFTGGPGHVWQTTNAGASWSDFTGSGVHAIPDSPSNAVVVDAAAHVVYVGTDVGVFQSSTVSTPSWTEVGPIPNSSGVAGFLPDVAVTALAIFNSGGQKLLRASTYGRGIWQYNVLAKPDFEFAISNSPLTVFEGVTAVFNGTVTELNGYNDNVDLSCVAGSSSPPVPCTLSPVSLTPTQTGAPFSITTTGTNSVADYNFNVQGVGFDPDGTTHTAPLTLNVVSWSMTNPSPASVTDPRGAVSPATNIQISALGTFNQSVSLSCSFSPSIPGASCAFTPGATFNLTSASPVSVAVTVTVPAGTTTGPYGVTISATTASAPAALTKTFTATVVLNPTFILSEPSAFPNVKAGSSGTTGTIDIASQDGFAGSVNLSCVTTYGTGSCSITSPVTVNASGPAATATLTINGSSFSAGAYQVSVQGTSGSLSGTLPVAFNVGDYTLAAPASLTAFPGGIVAVNLTIASEDFYTGQVSLTCTPSCTLAPASPVFIGSGTAVPVTATFTAPATVGNSNLSIATNDLGGEPAHTSTTVLTVQDFTLGVITPSTQSVGAGQSPTYNLTVAPKGAAFSNSVTLSCSGAPANSTCSFTPNPVTPGSDATAVAMTVATTANTPQGTSTLAITGTSGSLSHPAADTASLIVTNSLALAVNPSTLNGVDAGTTIVTVITVTPNYSGSMTATCDVSALPGTQCTLINSGLNLNGSPVSFPVSGSAVALTASLNIPTSAAPGSYKINFNVADASGAPSQSASLTLAVASDFNLTPLSPSTQTITAGQSITYNFSVQPIGGTFNGTVTFSCGGAPTISLCSFSPTSVTPGNSAAAVVMTISTTGSAAGIFRNPAVYFFGSTLAWIAWLLRRRRRSRHWKLAPAWGGLMLILLALTMLSCGSAGTNVGGGGGGGGGGGNGQGTQTGTYTITVTGTSGSLNHAGSPGILIVN